jgi:EAL domain-containing protein (putative c-di-GMP-specific phosphodiesterase class I)/ActR/RegA family two-component response regulator
LGLGCPYRQLGANPDRSSDTTAERDHSGGQRRRCDPNGALIVPNPLRILVADDEPDLLELLRINLEAEGHEVQLASTGTQALAMCQAAPPDLVVLDVMMPGLDGLDVVRALRHDAANKSLPIVLLSARGSDGDVFEGWRSGANYYITKPFRIEELLTFIDQLQVPARDEGPREDLMFGSNPGTESVGLASNDSSQEGPSMAATVSGPGTPVDVEERRQLERDLRGALEAGEFFLVYQPTFELHNVSVTGIEALLRWRHPGRGTVQPAEFIPLLEETGLIVDVGRWVLLDACCQAAVWRHQGYELNLSVNIATRQIQMDRIIDDVREALTISGLDAASLMIDVTETALTSDPHAIKRRLAALKALGIQIAIDDFGVNHLSLADLREFPVDTLKIDRSFMAGIVASAEKAGIMHQLVDTGKTLGLYTLAKGIEESEQFVHLQREQCDSGQGFLFAPSLDVEAVGQLLSTWAFRAEGEPTEPEDPRLVSLPDFT